MLTEDQIKVIIDNAVKAKLPDWKQRYFEFLCTNLQVHTKGLLFKKIDALFPHEHPDSKEHCISTYEPITKGSIWKGINDISRIFSNSSFSFESSDETRSLVESTVFNSQNLFNSFLTNWVDWAIATDANALCAIYPPEYVAKGNDYVRFVKSEHIRQFDEDVIVFISEEESNITESVEDSVIKKEYYADSSIGGINARHTSIKTYNQRVVVKVDNPVYHVFTKEYFLKFHKENKADHYTVDVFYFKNPHSSIPCFVVGGNKLYKGINESFAAPFIPFGNLALLQHRNHRAVDLIFSYPRMSEMQMPCENDCQPNEAGVYCKGENECPVCKGKGERSIQSPYKVYQKRIDTSGLNDPEMIKAILAASPVDFHTPDVNILNYSKDSWKEYLRLGEEAIFVLNKRSSGDAESADSKRLDFEDKFSWLRNISKAYFGDLAFVIQALENYINNSPVTISIEEPKGFAIITEGEAFEVLNNIINSDTPVFVKANQVEVFVHKYFSKSSPIIKALRILKKVDPLLFYSNKDVQTFKSNTVVSTESWSMHVFAYPILMQLYENDKKLFDKEDISIIDQLNAAVKDIIPSQSDLKASIINSM